MILQLIFCSLFVAASGRECTDKGERLELLLKLTMLHFVFRGVHPGLSMSSVRGRQQENRFQSEINFIFSILDIELDNKKFTKRMFYSELL